MNETLALFVDAYRELNSKKLFWMTINLSWMVVVIFLALGINDHGMTVFGWHLPIHADYNAKVVSPATFYRDVVFYKLGVNVWLVAIATLLALVSTSGIFPDFLSDGSIELYMSTPMSRLRLFLTKYVSGLLFVGLQITVFVVASFIVLRIRAGEWIPKLFLAIPLVVLYYSYIYCVCVLLGILTRSNTTSLILTILFWLTIFAVQELETVRYLTSMLKQQIVIQRIDREIAVGFSRVTPKKSVADLREDREENQKELEYQITMHRLLYVLEAVLPKTNDTVAIMRRNLISPEEDKRAEGKLGDPDSIADPVVINRFGTTSEDERAGNQMFRIVQARPLSWSIGTSLIFEAVVVSVAATLFCRRDY